MMKRILFIFLPLLFLFSCSVQKRKYQKGFYVSSSKYKTQVKRTEAIEHKKEPIRESLTSIPTELMVEQKAESEASADIKFKPGKLIKKVLFATDKTEACDLITLKNGEEISAKVLEITSIEVKYKKCDSPDGPLYVVRKSDVFMIKYANGTKEVFKATEEQKGSSSSSSSQKNNNPVSTHELAILAIVFGVLGLIVGIGSIPAIIAGNAAIRKINAEPDKYDGLDMAKIGKILGIIGIIAKILIFLLVLALIMSI
jgi:hypothetical protein